MRGGSLRHRITIEQRTDTPSAVGQRKPIWTTFATVWATIKPISGTEQRSGDQIKAATTHLIRCRFLYGLTNKHRIVLGARTFDINAVKNLDELSKEIEISAVENL